MASMHVSAQAAAAAELAITINNTPVGDGADTMLKGTMDNVSPEVIATCLMTRASNNDSHTSAITLIAELDCAAFVQHEAPPNTENQAANQQSNQASAGSSHRRKEIPARVNSAALCDKMLRSMRPCRLQSLEGMPQMANCAKTLHGSSAWNTYRCSQR
jgi:hypothetical protein